ncbi:Cytochrome P450 71D11 (Fragment) [Linum grandiflorum]
MDHLPQIPTLLSPIPLLLVVTFTAISFVSIIAKKLSQSYRGSKKSTDGGDNNVKYLPPAPWKLPFIGHIHHFLATAQPPHRRLRELSQKHGDVIGLDLGEINHVVVSSAEAAKQVMRTHDISFAQRPFHPHQAKVMYGGINLIHAPYGEYWRQLRRIATLELLTARRVESMRRVREAEVLTLMKDISNHAGSTIDLSRKLFNMTYCIISRATFGDVSGEQEEFIQIAEEMVEYGGGFGLAYLFPSNGFIQKLFSMESWLDKIHEGSDRLAESIISQHRERRKLGKVQEADEDLLDVLLNLQEDETTLGFNLSNNAIKAFMLDLFLAGSETPSALIEWTMSEMVKHPKVLQRAQSEVRKLFADKGRVEESQLYRLDYLQLVIKEALRLHTPAPLVLPRECREECRVGGYDIPLKTTVVVNVWAIARDPRYWGKDAEEFRPERFADSSVSYKGGDFEFLPFGAGRRMCPGMGFGLASVELSLANLLFHFDWKLPLGVEPEKLNMDEVFGITIRRKKHLELVPAIYNPVL